jgi:hypothetical protein
MIDSTLEHGNHANKKHCDTDVMGGEEHDMRDGNGR